MSKSTASTGSVNTIGVLAFKDCVEDAATTVKLEQYAPYGHPATFLKIANGTTTTARNYPYDGATPTISNKSSQSVFDISSGILSTVGLLIQMTSGNAIGQARRIISHSTNTVTVSPAFDAGTALVNGDSYTLFLDCGRLSQLIIKAEYSASTTTSDICGVFFEWERNVLDDAYVKSKKFYSAQRTLENLAIQADTEESNYYQAIGLPIDVRGARGAKVRLVSISNGSVSLWACAI